MQVKGEQRHQMRAKTSQATLCHELNHNMMSTYRKQLIYNAEDAACLYVDAFLPSALLSLSIIFGPQCEKASQRNNSVYKCDV